MTELYQGKITRKCCANCGNCSETIFPATKWYKQETVYTCNVPRLDSGKTRRTHPDTWCTDYKKRSGPGPGSEEAVPKHGAD